MRHYAPLPERSLGELLVIYVVARRNGRISVRLLLCAPENASPVPSWTESAGIGLAMSDRPRVVSSVPQAVRLLAPFDPVVWDRRRFEIFWGWTYRFEAYTPAPQRQRGYYALPLLWRDQAIGWANLVLRDGQLEAELGYVSGRAPTGAAFAPALDDELQRMCDFLGCARAWRQTLVLILR